MMAGQFPYSKITVVSSVNKGETQGFMKLLVDASTKQILDASILGTSGDEAIALYGNVVDFLDT